MLTLYYTSGTCARASHITLEEAGADYETVRVNFATNDQNKPEFLAINPKGRVPALVTDRGILTETPAILLYIAQCFPDAGLAPVEDHFATAELQSINSYLCSTVHVFHAHRPRGSRWADDEASIDAMKKKVPENMLNAFQHIEKNMFKGPWVMGDTYTVADPYLFTLSCWLKGDGVNIDDLPTIAEHRERMLERPAVQKVLAVEEA